MKKIKQNALSHVSGGQINAGQKNPGEIIVEEQGKGWYDSLGALVGGIAAAFTNIYGNKQ